MYAPETYKPSSDADKVPDGVGGRESGGDSKEKKRGGWLERKEGRVFLFFFPSSFFPGWVKSKAMGSSSSRFC